MGDFEITPDDYTFYEKVKVPPPTFCPPCRNQRRMLFRNFKTLYNIPSSKSGKTIISMYNQNAPFPVYEAKDWWADDWDALDYGRDVYFNRPFFEQLKELFNVVPRMGLMNTKSNGCEYSNMTYGSNNCYLVFGCVEDENCDYGHIVWESRDSIDNLYIFKSEFCYECVDCLGCNSLFYSQECESCADSIGLYNCKSCTNCIGCVGLRQKSYHIFNQPVTKEEYETFKKKYPLGDKESISYILSKVEELKKVNPEPELFGSRNVNVTGNHVYNAHNVYNSFDIKSGENSKYGYTVKKFVDSYDCIFTPGVESCYETLNCVGSYIVGSHLVMDSSYTFYSDSCYGSNNLFGCAGLKQKNYCILNKQYSKEEYEKLVPQIIELMKKHGEFGQFFPKELSPFSYNESIVNEYMPIEKDEALVLGFNWSDTLPKTVGQGTITFDAVPKNAEFYDDTLLSEVFTCDECERNFRLIDRELTFYKRFDLSIPHKCFQCRHKHRMNKRNPRMLHIDACDFCKKNIQTSIPTQIRKNRIVYCEDCYKREVL
jgi:hypothetical protein